MPKVRNRVKETTTTTGTGTITLAGAVSSFQTFASEYAVGERVTYCIVGQTGSEWEVGTGFMLSSTTLSRSTVEASSNSDALVNFSAGTKDVFATVSAADVVTRGKLNTAPANVDDVY